MVNNLYKEFINIFINMKNYFFYFLLIINIYNSLSFVHTNSFYKYGCKSKSILNLNKNIFDICYNNNKCFNYNITISNIPEIVYYDWLNFIWYNYYGYDIIEGDIYGKNSIRQHKNLHQKIVNISYPNYIKYKQVELFNFKYTYGEVFFHKTRENDTLIEWKIINNNNIPFINKRYINNNNIPFINIIYDKLINRQLNYLKKITEIKKNQYIE